MHWAYWFCFIKLFIVNTHSKQIFTYILKTYRKANKSVRDFYTLEIKASVVILSFKTTLNNYNYINK